MRDVELTEGKKQIRWHMRQEPVYCDNGLLIRALRDNQAADTPNDYIQHPYQVKTLEGWRVPKRVYIKRPEKLP